MANTLKVIQSDETFEQRLAKLNLRNVMARVEEEYGIEGADLARAEELYGKFLTLIAQRGDSEVSYAPPRIVDLVWHTHITDTRAYARDCDYLFGHFVHHVPTPRDGFVAEQTAPLSTHDYFMQFDSYKRISPAMQVTASCGN